VYKALCTGSDHGVEKFFKGYDVERTEFFESAPVAYLSRTVDDEIAVFDTTSERSGISQITFNQFHTKAFKELCVRAFSGKGFDMHAPLDGLFGHMASDQSCTACDENCHFEWPVRAMVIRFFFKH
jgi:hypothetical protein